jgi:hypothetical protein
MTRKLKAIGLALVAVFALSAVAASGASASAFTSFNTSNSTMEGGTFSGSQTTTHKFTAGTGVGSVTCAEANFSGTSAGGEETEPVAAATYGNCHVEVLGVTYTTHVTMNGCTYKFHITGGSADAWTGTADVVCPVGAQIDVKITKSGSEETKCTIKIGAQTGLNNVSYENNTAASPTDIVVKTETNNVTDTTEGGSLGCGIGNGTHTNGTYFGSTTIKGFNGAGTQIDLTVM